ncbi:MAG: hypothetical protein KA419_20015 [Acidobacteria bacterium]|nr:hypothetical protein [Acidobacteriota bacterium]
MTVRTNLFVLTAVAILALCGCGKTGETAPPATGAPATQADQPAAPGAESEGVLLAKEILAMYDAAVAEAAEIGKDKPEPAVIKPKLEALILKYEPKMKELNAKYLALKAKDVVLFGDCNGYMGQNRGKHVFQKDNTLGMIIAYYNQEKVDKDVADLLGLKLAALIDLATKM